MYLTQVSVQLQENTEWGECFTVRQHLFRFLCGISRPGSQAGAECDTSSPIPLWGRKDSFSLSLSCWLWTSHAVVKGREGKKLQKTVANMLQSKVKGSFVLGRGHEAVQVEFESPLLQWQRPGESRSKKLLQKWTLRTRGGAETCNKSCGLGCLQGPGGNGRNWNVGASEQQGVVETVANPKMYVLLSLCWRWTCSFQNLLIFCCSCCFQMKLAVWLYLCHFLVISNLSTIFFFFFWYRPNITCLWASVLSLP